MSARRPAVEIDTEKLWSAVHYRLFRTEKTAVEIARVLGFSPQMFSNLKATAKRRSGYQPSGPIFLTICWWLGTDPREFQRLRAGVADEMFTRTADEAAERLIDEILAEAAEGES